MEEKTFEFLFPSNIQWEKETYRNNYGKLVVEPLERGFGVTAGNALRRVLLSSIPGVAITGVKILGIPHEFSTIKGVKEDFTQIILNLKQVACKPVVSKFPHRVSITIAKKEEICAADLINDGSVEILNPDLHIATIDPDVKLDIELEITRGIGYVPVEKMKLMRRDTGGFILIDGLYTPIKKVSFHVENTRVGPLVDYEKLVLEIWTNGAVTPFDAIKTGTDILNNHFSLIGSGQSIGAKDGRDSDSDVAADLDTRITELKLPTRVVNALNNQDIKTLGDILRTPRERFEEMKNLGKKSLQEIEEVLEKRGKKLSSLADLPEKTEQDNAS